MQRRLGLTDAVVLGLGSMLGAGIFAALGPAADAAGTGAGLLAGLTVAAVVAWCNASSSARLAARYPASGGTYVYGRERLGPFWGFLAGWAFVTGKTASCAAIALTLGSYLWPDRAHLAAVLAVLAVTGVNLAGVQKSARVTGAVVAVVLTVLVALVLAVAFDLARGEDGVRPALGGGTGAPGTVGVGVGGVGVGGVGVGGIGVGGVLAAAGLLFFAFAGYARIATLGEEVRDPQHTIPRAIGLALAITLAVYAAVALAVLAVLGADGLAAAGAPLAVTADRLGAGWLERAVLVAAAVATVGSLLSLTLGVSRTSLAMARDRYLPRALSVLSRRDGVPRRAEAAVGIVVAGVAATADLRHAIGFSSFAVLLYYTVANASAWTLPAVDGPRLAKAQRAETAAVGTADVAAQQGSAGQGSARPTMARQVRARQGRARQGRARPTMARQGSGPRLRARLVAAGGLAGCLLLAFSLPARSVVLGAAVTTLGALLYPALRHDRERRRHDRRESNGSPPDPGAKPLAP